MLHSILEFRKNLSLMVVLATSMFFSAEAAISRDVLMKVTPCVREQNRCKEMHKIISADADEGTMEEAFQMYKTARKKSFTTLREHFSDLNAIYLDCKAKQRFLEHSKSVFGAESSTQAQKLEAQGNILIYTSMLREQEKNLESFFDQLQRQILEEADAVGICYF